MIVIKSANDDYGSNRESNAYPESFACLTGEQLYFRLHPRQDQTYRGHEPFTGK
jgi:hypothetical protein